MTSARMPDISVASRHAQPLNPDQLVSCKDILCLISEKQDREIRHARQVRPLRQKTAKAQNLVDRSPAGVRPYPARLGAGLAPGNGRHRCRKGVARRRQAASLLLERATRKAPTVPILFLPGVGFEEGGAARGRA